MYTTIKTVLLVLLLIPSFYTLAQTPPTKMKMGKATEEMVALTQYEKDTSAVAFVIGDFGYLSFEAAQSSFRTSLKRHVRIKILKQEGLEYANILLKFYNRGSSKETVSSIKGYVYNYVDGEVVREKLDNDNVFEEEISENLTSKKISFANVKIGSVIEYSYVKKSDFIYAPDDWIAQRDIPILATDFKFGVPEYFTYKVKNSRYYRLSELKSSSTSQSFNFTELKESITQSVQVRHWREEFIPAFEEEPFMTSPNDYLARIEMELESSNGGMSQHTTSWNSVLSKLENNGSGGGQLSKTGFMKEELEAIEAKTENKEERAKLVYQLIQNRMTWDKGYGCYTREGGTRKAYQKMKGNVAEINYMLIAGLRKVGVSAFPLLGSTRSHGKVIQMSPSLSQLSYVMVYVVDGEKEYFLDATTKTHPFKVLPKRALNYQGVLMSDNDRVNGEFVAISPNVKDELYETLLLDIQPDLSIQGTYKGVSKGYKAISWRKMYNSYDEEDEYLTEIEDENQGLIINEYSNKGLENIEETPVEKFSFELEDNIEKAGNAYVLNPLKILNIAENPFKLEERKYPVEFAYPMRRKFTIQVVIPEGFSIKELPKSSSMSLSDKKSGILRYIVSPNGNVITIMVDFKVNRLVFGPDEYVDLKRFYEEAYSFQNSPIVLVQNQ